MPAEPQIEPGHRACDLVLTAIVGAIAAMMAASMLAEYAANPGALWQGLYHDRNGHFNYGLDFALALRDFDIFEFLKNLLRSQVWPPVHGLVLASVLTFGGIDMWLAIVPSLLGWVATIMLTYAIAAGLFAERATGVIAGALAITFAMASPGFRLITADVMLEGLGAALTALCLFSYLRARASSGEQRWSGVLAISLTALFFEKSNYWVLTAVPLAIAAVSENVGGCLTWYHARFSPTDIRAALLRAVRDPYLIVATALILLVIAIAAHGPAVVQVFGQRVSLYPPENLTTLAYGLVFIRAALAWRAHRAAIDATLRPAGRYLFYWHVVPIAASFLLPKRLSVFLWYVGPTHFHETAIYNPFHALVAQWHAFAEGFHVAPWAAALVTALAVVATVRLPRLAPGARAVAILAALSALAVVLHPQQQWRFQTTWLFAVWILAGAGGAMILSSLTARLPLPARIGIAAAVFAAIVWGESRYRWTDMAYTVAIHPYAGPSDLELARVYLPHLTETHSVGVIALPESVFYSWTIHEHCRCRTVVKMPKLPDSETHDVYRRLITDWLADFQAERLISIDRQNLRPTPYLGQAYDSSTAALEAIENNPAFEKIATEPVPAIGITVAIWQRRP